MKLHMIRLALVLALAGVTAGCFGPFGGGSDEPEATATVVVRNDIDPPAAVTIHMVRVGDGEKSIGTVSPGQERTLTYSSSDLQGTYQLVARQSSGAAVTSRQFTLFADAQVHWQIRSNTLSVMEAR